MKQDILHQLVFLMLLVMWLFFVMASPNISEFLSRKFKCNTHIIELIFGLILGIAFMAVWSGVV